MLIHRMVMGQPVPLVKDNVSHASRGPWLHTPHMAISPSQREFEDQLRKRVKRLRGARTQLQMATLLEIEFEAYKKYETRSPLPQYLIPKFAMIVGCDIAYLLTGKSEGSAARRVIDPVTDGLAGPLMKKVAGTRSGESEPVRRARK